MIQIFFFLFISFSIATAQTPFFNDHARGWFWYEDPAIDPLPNNKSEEEKKDEVSSSVPAKTAMQEMEELQNHLKELKARAILYPSIENVKAFQSLQMKVMNMSKTFSETWVYNVTQNPTLDANVQNPTVQAGRPMVYEQERNEQSKIIDELRQEYGLFYFYSGNCKFCEVFSPIVQIFAEKYKWDIIPISLDGMPSNVFRNWQNDNGISKQFNVKHVPALYAVNPTTGHIIPISHGVSSVDQMEQRITKIVMFERQHQQRGY